MSNLYMTPYDARNVMGVFVAMVGVSFFRYSACELWTEAKVPLNVMAVLFFLGGCWGLVRIAARLRLMNVG